MVDVEDNNGAKVKVLEHSWCINYTSCTNYKQGSNPFTAARVVNEHLYKSQYINSTGNESTKEDCLKHIGIIASDFVDAALARSIYQRNYDAKHKQTVSYYLPTRIRMIYGDSLSDASLQDGKTVGEGRFRLVDSSNVLNVAASGNTFAIEYVDVDALGNETVTELQGSVPIDIDPRALTPHFEGLEALRPARTCTQRSRRRSRASSKAMPAPPSSSLCTMQTALRARQWPRMRHFAAGTYWVRAKGLLGDAAQNYKLASDGAASFTVTASGQRERHRYRRR